MEPVASFTPPKTAEALLPSALANCLRARACTSPGLVNRHGSDAPGQPCRVVDKEVQVIALRLRQAHREGPVCVESMGQTCPQVQVLRLSFDGFLAGRLAGVERRRTRAQLLLADGSEADMGTPAEMGVARALRSAIRHQGAEGGPAGRHRRRGDEGGCNGKRHARCVNLHGELRVAWSCCSMAVRPPVPSLPTHACRPAAHRTSSPSSGALRSAPTSACPR